MMSPAAWLEANRELWAMVMPAASVNEVLAHPEGEPWSTVRGALVAIQGSSMLGKRLFAWAALAALETSLDETIENCVAALMKEPVIDDSILRKHTKQCKTAVDALPGLEGLPERRDATMKYRTFEIKLPVKSVAEHIDWACRAAVRGRAAEAGALEALVGEEVVCKGATTGSEAKVANSLLLKAAAARNFLKDKLRVWRAKGGDAIEELQKIKHEGEPNPGKYRRGQLSGDLGGRGELWVGLALGRSGKFSEGFVRKFRFG